MEFDSRAIAVTERLRRAGFEAYLVGGCVRDGLRGVPPHDYDVTASALPDEILQAFSDLPTVKTGIRHGTVTVLSDGLPVEVTTYRIDGAYADGRHPDSVRFSSSLEADLARRDFTVNAMAWTREIGVVDLFCGQDDLRAGILRCVGDPQRRFQEDALRILRGLRFASVLGFSLDPETDGALRALKDRLSLVSQERITEEFTKLLCGAGAKRILAEYPEVFGVFLPELLPCVGFDQRNFHHCYDLYTHLLHAVDAVPPEPRLRWAALLHDVGKPETFSRDGDGVGHFYGHASRSSELADEILRRLRVDNETRNAVVTLIRHHDSPIPPDPVAVRRRLGKLGPEGFFDLLSLVRADTAALAPQFRSRSADLDRVEALAREILAEKQCFSLKDLAVKGGDLLALGYRGKEIGDTLNLLLERVLSGRIENEKTALLNSIKEMDED